MGLTLSEQKTRVTELTEGFRFLGCLVRLKWDDRYGLGCRVEIPKEVANDFRWRVKKVLRRQTQVRSLDSMLQELNPILRGWANYYRHCVGAKRILSALDLVCAPTALAVATGQAQACSHKEAVRVMAPGQPGSSR